MPWNFCGTLVLLEKYYHTSKDFPSSWIPQFKETNFLWSSCKLYSWSLSSKIQARTKTPQPSSATNNPICYSTLRYRTFPNSGIDDPLNSVTLSEPFLDAANLSWSLLFWSEWWPKNPYTVPSKLPDHWKAKVQISSFMSTDRYKLHRKCCILYGLFFSVAPKRIFGADLHTFAKWLVFPQLQQCWFWPGHPFRMWLAEPHPK